jgi:2-(1,2-epoxy-1,2-dihydrophenyl)acetyl-CoA isomerase
MDCPLDIEHRGAAAWLTLNRPDQGNSVNVAMAEALRDAALGLARDSSVRAIAISGAGRMFCAGGDITTFTASGDPEAAIHAITSPLHAAIETLMAMDKPVVTIVNGPAAGAGLGLAMLGDIVLAARSAHFTAAYTAIGLTPDGGTSWLLPRLIGLRRATDMVLTNRRVGADEAQAIGLVSRVVDDDSLAGEGEALLERLSGGAIGALAKSRLLLAEGLGRSLSDQLAIEANSIAKSAADDEGREGVASFMERREPRWYGPAG